MTLQSFTIDTETYSDMREESEGFCRACGEPAYGVEPDARKYQCESCDAKQVYGIEELLLMGKLTITE